MRQILVEYARAHRAAKRDGGRSITFNEEIAVFKNRAVDLVELDDALNDLAKLDPQQSRIVELRFFGGLSIDETARVLGISPATVKRDWATAKAWLYYQMSKTTAHDS
jgi:RNA polymerase sigma factor (TIGR02999 family)